MYKFGVQDMKLNAHTPKNQVNEKKKREVALKAFFNIMDLWSVTDDQAQILLGHINHSTFYNWKRTHYGQLTHDQLCRISLILGIYKSLQILFPDTESADSWIKKSNKAPIFSGRSALEIMLSGNYEDLVFLRQYLDAQRGGWG